MYPPPPSPRARRRRVPLSLLVTLVLVAAAFLVVAGLRFVPGSPLAASAADNGVNPSPSGTSSSAPTGPGSPDGPAAARNAPPPLAVRPAAVRLDRDGWWSWAMLDRRTGKIYGSTNMAATSTTASLIKAWIGADFLRRAAEDGQTPSELRMEQLTIMIRDSDNDAAQALWSVVGRRASTERMVELCGMTDSTPHPNWSNTKLSPRDVARLGACIADGRAAGPKWTKWLLKEMRLVRGAGDFGIRKAFPPGVAKTIAVKNGWVIRDNEGNWHVNCLAIGDGWTMGVMTRFPTNRDFSYGGDTCQQIARQLRR